MLLLNRFNCVLFRTLATAARRSLREQNGRNPEKYLSGVDPGAKTFPTIPQTCSYIAQETGFCTTSAEFNRDVPSFSRFFRRNLKKSTFR